MENLNDPQEQERASLIFSIRFGDNAITDWSGWKTKLQVEKSEIQKLKSRVRSYVEALPAQALFVWYSTQDDREEKIFDLLANSCASNTSHVPVEAFLQHWRHLMPTDEAEELFAEFRTESATPTASPVETEQLQEPEVTLPTTEPALKRNKELVEKIVKSKVPSIWNEHLQPFFMENWYMFAGIIMMVVGSSLLAYYTWDKHWLIRYTVMPGMLLGFTFSLAWAGSWLERKDEELIGTAAMLRSAAIGLLPVNFMAVALLIDDPLVSQKNIVVPAMVIFYTLIFGRGLSAWCAAVHPGLRKLLGYTLMLINSLVVLAPLSRAMGVANVEVITSIGFYTGFGIVAWSIVGFSRKILTKEMVLEGRVPWFFGAAAVLTFLQVFAWVHGYMRFVPNVTTYSSMIIAIGWLVLLVERQTLKILSDSDSHRPESFLGFALILFGILMGAGGEYSRIFAFLLAGGVWLYQALSRRNNLHYWIALTLLTLGGAALGLLHQFPGPWFGVLGLGLSITMAGLGVVTKSKERTGLADACKGMKMSILALSTVVTVLTQWHFHSAPLKTALILFAIAILFADQAKRDGKLRWVHSSMIALALALPYLGCVDVEGRTFQGNTMVFGLSILSFFWLMLNRIVDRPTVRNARSTVLWLYGGLGVVSMILRVVFERNAVVPIPFQGYADFIGPFMMTLVLIITAYHSRSIVPSIMAVLIVVILFPELKANFQATFDQMGWGSGFGSATWSALLVISSFALREWKFLKNLSDGDKFMGTDSFPLRRNDHTLFTWTMIGSAIYLGAKVNTWNLIHNTSIHGIRLKTSLAIALTGVTWTLLGVYFRDLKKKTQLGTYLGWTCYFVGLSMAYDNLSPDPKWYELTLIGGLSLQLMYFVYRFVLEPRRTWAASQLTAPTKTILQYLSFLACAFCISSIFNGETVKPISYLVSFLAIQLVWDGLRNKQDRYGLMLYVLSLSVLLEISSPGSGPLLNRFRYTGLINPFLIFVLVIQALHLYLETNDAMYKKIKSLIRPFHSGATVLIIFSGCFSFLDF